MFSFLSFEGFCQYDFEKFKRIKFEREFEDFNNWVLEKKDVEGLFPEHLLKGISNFFNDKSHLYFEIIPLSKESESSSKIYIYKNKKIISSYNSELPISSINLMNFGIADFDGNGYKDIALKISYMGNGTASLNVKNIFLYQTSDSEFKVIDFNDKGYGLWYIHDINKDKNFEIFTKHLTNHAGHSYFLFNTYRFNGEKLINVNDEINYPIMVQFLYKENYKTTKNLSRNSMKKYSIEDPTKYDWIK